MKESCINCQNDIIVNDSDAGKTISCKKCGTEYFVYSELVDDYNLELYLNEL